MTDNTGLHPVNTGDLKAITDAASAVDSNIAVIAWLKANQSIKADVAATITNALNHHREKLEPALMANVHRDKPVPAAAVSMPAPVAHAQTP
jgi:hypothetical protein